MSSSSPTTQCVAANLAKGVGASLTLSPPLLYSPRTLPRKQLTAFILGVPLLPFTPLAAVPAPLRPAARAFNSCIRRANTVFISYRWTTQKSDSRALAKTLKSELEGRFQLRVFLDVEGLEDGSILDQLPRLVGSHDAFIPILAPQCYDRSLANPRDAVRVEVETAIATKRIIVPLFTEEWFKQENNFGKVELPASMQPILGFNGVEHKHAYGSTCFDLLHERIQGWNRGERMRDD